MIFLWVDESDKHGEFYSNFYGGVLIESKHLNHVMTTLEQTIEELHIDEEIKWQKVNEYWFERYQRLVDVVFDLMGEGYLKMRIFFRHNQYVARGLTVNQRREEYQRLYYQFIKHAFGWKFANPSNREEYVCIMLDDMPISGKENEDFKSILYQLNNDRHFCDANLHIRQEDIVEVNSKTHLPLQVMDLILGAICFRLNEKHKEKPEGSRIRGKRTIVKEKLYKHINMRIRDIMPGFNIGISTGHRKVTDVWENPYRHWSFVPHNYEHHKELTKKQKNNPI